MKNGLVQQERILQVWQTCQSSQHLLFLSCPSQRCSPNNLPKVFSPDSLLQFSYRLYGNYSKSPGLCPDFQPVHLHQKFSPITPTSITSIYYMNKMTLMCLPAQKFYDCIQTSFQIGWPLCPPSSVSGSHVPSSQNFRVNPQSSSLTYHVPQNE